MESWTAVAQENELAEKLTVCLADREIMLTRHDGAIYAINNVCSHAYARLSEGDAWNGTVYCPKHGSGFDVKTGAVKGLPATKPVETYDVKTENGTIFLKSRNYA
ncbi:MAG: Rieske 2Fe-2S domain-containing protein [Chitinivibrionales bacterium]|nr:Rieske 2Fe-2S domain-containing protein [Chitinivibrionales bacterium]